MHSRLTLSQQAQVLVAPATLGAEGMYACATPRSAQVGALGQAFLPGACRGPGAPCCAHAAQSTTPIAIVLALHDQSKVSRQPPSTPGAKQHHGSGNQPPAQQADSQEGDAHPHGEAVVWSGEAWSAGGAWPALVHGEVVGATRAGVVALADPACANRRLPGTLDALTTPSGAATGWAGCCG